LPSLARGRREFLLTGSSLVVAPWAGGAVSALPRAHDLSAELTLALKRSQPLIVMVSLDGCVHCERVRRSQLLPRLQEGQAIVQVDLRSSQSVKGWDGQLLTHGELAALWKISLAPTLLFFGPGGREVADRMEGAYQPDFYGAYFDQRLSRAQHKL